MKNRYLLSTLGLLAALSASTSFAGPHRDAQYSQKKVKGEAVTGWNQRMGQPVKNLPIVGPLNFSLNGVCGEEHASPITADTDTTSQLCTYADPAIYQFIFNSEVTPEFPKNQNIRLSEFPQIFTSDGQEKALPSVHNAQWFEASNGSQSFGYTVDDWLAAKGSMTFRCKPGDNSYQLRASNLVPGGLYTLWLFYFDQVNPPPPQGTGGFQPDLAFGGASANVFVADRYGRINGTRDMGFCPQAWSEDEQYQPLNLHLVLHPEGRVYGTVAEQTLAPPFNGGPGIVAIPQLMFTLPR